MGAGLPSKTEKSRKLVASDVTWPLMKLFASLWHAALKMKTGFKTRGAGLENGVCYCLLSCLTNNLNVN